MRWLLVQVQIWKEHFRLKNNRLDIRPYICFQLIEWVVTYNEGVMFEEYTRFEGREDYIYFDDNYNIKCVTNIDDASVLCQADEPNVMLVKLVNDMMMLIASFSGKVYSLRAQENRKEYKQKENETKIITNR